MNSNVNEEKSIILVNFNLHKDVVKVLDQLAETGLYKTRVDVLLSALRAYKPFQDMWKKEAVTKSNSNNI